MVSIMEACKKYGIEILELSVQQDHVHLIANLPRGMTDIKAVQLIKGFSSYLLFRLVPNFRLRYSRGNLWSRGSFATTVGFANLDTAMEYVKSQDIRHSGNYGL